MYNSERDIYDRDYDMHGCGYWSLCLDRACPCSPTAPVQQGFSIDLWNKLKVRMEADLKDHYGPEYIEGDWPEDDDDDYPEEAYDGPLYPDEDDPPKPNPRAEKIVETYLKGIGIRIVPPGEKEDR